MPKLMSLLVLLSCYGIASANEVLQFNNAWVKQAPPSSKILAAYGELKNISDKNIRVVSISSDYFKKIEIHMTTLHNGMMHMEKLPQLIIKANEVFLFEPGARHFMLIKPKIPIDKGTRVPFKFETESGEIFSFSLPVKR